MTTLQTRLFRRVGNHLELIDTKRVLLPGFVRKIAQIETAVYAISTEKSANVLTVTTLSTFAIRWLIPHLAIFQAQHTEAEGLITGYRITRGKLSLAPPIFLSFILCWTLKT